MRHQAPRFRCVLEAVTFTACLCVFMGAASPQARHTWTENGTPSRPLVVEMAPAPAAPGLDASALWGGIREVGFPAAAFVMLWYLVRTSLRDMQASMQRSTEAISMLAVAVGELRTHCSARWDGAERRGS